MCPPGSRRRHVLAQAASAMAAPAPKGKDSGQKGTSAAAGGAKAGAKGKGKGTAKKVVKPKEELPWQPTLPVVTIGRPGGWTGDLLVLLAPEDEFEVNADGESRAGHAWTALAGACQSASLPLGSNFLSATAHVRMQLLKRPNNSRLHKASLPTFILFCISEPRVACSCFPSVMTCFRLSRSPKARIKNPQTTLWHGLLAVGYLHLVFACEVPGMFSECDISQNQAVDFYISLQGWDDCQLW